MAQFQRGETIVIRGTIKDSDRVLTTPATSTKITVTDSAGVVVVDALAVTFDSIGIWKYLYTPEASALAGAYHVRIVATDGSRISITDSDFFLIL